MMSQQLKGEKQLNNYRPALLWDVNGTIFDSKDCHYNTWEKALKQHGISLEPHTFEKYFGKSYQEIVPLLMGFEPDPDLVKEIIDLKEAFFKETAAQDVRLVKGVDRWLSDVKELGLSQAIASSAPMDDIKMLLTIFDLSPYFDAVVSGEDLPAKPDPAVFLRAAEVLDHSPQNCWVLEDSLHGVNAAKNAGMVCVAVTTTLPESELSKADVVLEDFTKPFKKILDRISQNIANQ
jgi:HAD superfamily hydrolase (TIGR01509 family)